MMRARGLNLFQAGPIGYEETCGRFHRAAQQFAFPTPPPELFKTARTQAGCQRARFPAARSRHGQTTGLVLVRFLFQNHCTTLRIVVLERQKNTAISSHKLHIERLLILCATTRKNGEYNENKTKTILAVTAAVVAASLLAALPSPVSAESPIGNTAGRTAVKPHQRPAAAAGLLAQRRRSGCSLPS